MPSDTTTQARALVASLLRGDLDAVTHTSQRHELRFAAQVLPLRRTPVTAVSSVTVAGEAVDSGAYSVTPFALVREDGGQWPAGAAIIVTYTTGWAQGGEPAEVQEALAQATAWFDANPGVGVSLVSIGGETVQRGLELTKFGIDLTKRLLQKWVRP